MQRMSHVILRGSISVSVLIGEGIRLTQKRPLMNRCVLQMNQLRRQRMKERLWDAAKEYESEQWE